MDVSEPYAMKQLLEKVRGTPDLAGLSRPAKIELKPRAYSSGLNLLRKGNNRAPERCGDDSSTRLGRVSESSIVVPTDAGTDLHQDPGSPMFSTSMTGDSERGFSGYQNEWPHRAMFSFSSMEIPASSSHVYERDGYSDEPTGEVEADESSSRPFQYMSSPPTSPGDESNQSLLRWSHEQPERDVVGVEHSNGQARDATNLSHSRLSSSNSIYCPEYRNEFDERGLPPFIRFPNSSEEYGLSSVYGTLFLHSDPWNVIGDILDRGEQSLNYDYDMGGVGRMAEDANMESSGNEYTTSFMYTRSDSESQDEDEGPAAQESPSIFGLDLDPFEGLGGQEEGMDLEEGPSDIEMGDGEFSSFMKRGSPTTKRHSSHLGLSQEYLPEQFIIQQRTGAHPAAPATPEVYQMDGSDVRADDHQTDNGDGIEGPSLGPNHSEMETNDVRLDPVEIESLLAMPELEEIGGRYVGPSLFSNEPDDDDCW